MYRRAKFIEILHEIRQEMAAEADYDVVLFAENVRSGDYVSSSDGLKRLRHERPARSGIEHETEAKPLKRG